MGGRACRVALMCAVVSAFAAAPAAAETVSAIGSAQVEVNPTDRRDNDSIVRAIAEARDTALPLAMADARTRAQTLADGVGLMLGDVDSIEEYRNPGFEGYGENGVFGPGQFCGTISRTVRRRTSSGRIVRRRVRQKRCFFPSALQASVEVTYHATRAGS